MYHARARSRAPDNDLALFYGETEAVAAPVSPFNSGPLPAAAGDPRREKCSTAWAIEAAVRFRQASEVSDFRSPRLDT